jgi:hypothetical protein
VAENCRSQAMDDVFGTHRAAQTHADLYWLLLDLPGPIPASQAPHLGPGLVPMMIAVLVAVLGFAVPLMALGRMPGCM